MKKNIFLLATCVVALASCYKEAPLTREVHDPAFTIEDGSAPGQHTVYDIWTKYGVAILSQYKEVDYKWNMKDTTSYTASRIDASFLGEAMDYLDETLFSLYGDAFKKEYFPFKIYLASEVTSRGSTDYTTDVYATCVRSGMVVGRLREGGLPADNASLKAATGWINATLWASYLVANERLNIPEEFYSVSHDYYGVNSLMADVNITDALTVGFFDYDHTNSLNDGSRYMFFPTTEQDIFQYIQKIMTTSSADMAAITKAYNPVRVKYNLLVNAIKDATGVDIQAIGDRVVAKYPTEE